MAPDGCSAASHHIQIPGSRKKSSQRPHTLLLPTSYWPGGHVILSLGSYVPSKTWGFVIKERRKDVEEQTVVSTTTLYMKERSSYLNFQVHLQKENVSEA